MDQVTKLYEELVRFDPSLERDREAVLQVIEKMIASKPVVAPNPIRKEQFAKKLADYIDMKKASYIPKSSISQRLAKWSFSLATSLVAIVVV
jgi:NAD dependent epimerase/dehydratase family enzyme